MGNNISYQDTPVEVNLGDKGAIRGIQRDDKARRFTGVRFALPPTGQHRWRKPRELPPSWRYEAEDGTPGAAYDATAFRTVCPQPEFKLGGDASVSYDEDCLFANIWTPVPHEGEKLEDKKWPVMLWIHGGWFQIGDPSHDPGMDPTELISTGKLDAVVVAVGYRLNVFGFLAGNDLLKDSDGAAAGNFGLWDQRAAAEWVSKYIHLFGGDPDNVTLAGRSAGAYSVEAQTLHEFRRTGAQSENQKGLYRRIFMASNAIPAQPKSVDDGQIQLDELSGYFGIAKDASPADKLAALRTKTSTELVAAIAHLDNHTFRPVTDDLFLHSDMTGYLARPDGFAADFARRKYKILVGEVLNEETLYSTYSAPTEPTLDALRLQVANYYAPAVADRAISLYELPKSDTLRDWQTVFGRIISDGQVRAPTRLLVKNLLDNGIDQGDIWRYRIAYRLSFIDDTVAPAWFGVAHAMDKPFWNFSITHGPTPKERTLMDDWIKQLVAFVHGRDFDAGTSARDDLRVATPEGTIEVQKDTEWGDLLHKADVFAGTA